MPESGAPIATHRRDRGARGRRREGDRAGSRLRARVRRSATVRALLRFPLLYKIFLANTALVLAAAAAASVLAVRIQRDPGASTLQVALFGLAVIALSALLNAVILRAALSPLRRLEDAADRVRRGQLDARAALSPLADPELERLTRLFNRMLDTLAAYRERLQGVATRALQAQELERKRIALELHDDTAQALASLLIRLRVVRNTADPNVRDARLEEVRNELAKAMESVRRFARALRPPALDEVGVVPAIREHARSVCETTGLKAVVEPDVIGSLLSRDAELVLYRIVQEALSNVVRHADASTVRVRIGRRDAAVVAEITDDGKGFVVADELCRGGRGLGLFGMQERAAYVGGRIDIDSRPGRGTTVRVTMPIQEGGGVG